MEIHMVIDKSPNGLSISLSKLANGKKDIVKVTYEKNEYVYNLHK